MKGEEIYVVGIYLITETVVNFNLYKAIVDPNVEGRPNSRIHVNAGE